MTDPNLHQPLPARRQIEHLHGLYCKLSGLPMRLDMHREAVWFEWLRRGFTAEDLALVLRHLRKAIAGGSRNPGALKFSNVIGQPDYFEEDLALSRAQGRARPPGTITVSTGPTTRRVANPGTAETSIPVGQVIEAMRAAAERKG